MRPAFTVIDDAEHRPGEWKLGERSTFF
jgi:hypothetical protein